LGMRMCFPSRRFTLKKNAPQFALAPHAQGNVACETISRLYRTKHLIAKPIEPSVPNWLQIEKACVISDQCLFQTPATVILPYCFNAHHSVERARPLPVCRHAGLRSEPGEHVGGVTAHLPRQKQVDVRCAEG